MKPLRDTLPRSVYTAAGVRELDRVAIEQRGIAGYELMNRAGQAALDVLREHWPEAHKITVYCGAGNNAGDGYVLARLARAAGMSVRLEAVVPPERLRGDARLAWEDCRDAGVAVEPFEAGADSGSGADAGFGAVGVSRFVPDVIVDALLGTGLDRPVEGAFAAAVDAVNAAAAPVLALDVPSGLDADTGLPLGRAVRASVTVTFVGLKQGLFLGEAPDYRGKLAFSGLMLPEDVAEGVTPTLERLHPDLLRERLPPRRRSAHKGAHGRLLLVGGAPGTAGAIRLAADAALRAGAGLVYVATHPDSVGAVSAGRPEAMVRGVGRADELDALLELADGVVLGPGLGRSDWAAALWRRVLDAPLPLVVDADGLNLLAKRPAARGNWLLTPHPGEASRLLERGASAVQRDRLDAVRALAARYRAAVVLKGAFTLVAEAPGEAVSVCGYGNPGLASGGTGDVLSGVLGGLLVQLGDLSAAARAGVLMHALAADDAAADGERGMLASDLMPALRRWANPS